MSKADDPLSSEVSIKGKVTDSGVELRAKSRLISGLDRLGGNLSELVNAPMERRTARIRGEVKIIEEAAAAAVARIRANPELADPLINHQLAAASRRLTNQAAATVEALEDLSARPPTAEQAASGSEKLSPEFLDRWERYAEDASTDELRAKWGKVLASEIRKPGRISRRTMRALDELPSDIAVRFEELCAHRLDRHLIKGSAGLIPFADAATLAFYGLVIDPGSAGHVLPLEPSSEGDQVWLYFADERAVGLPKGIEPKLSSQGRFLSLNEATPAVPIYALTDVGFELASIFEDRTEQAWSALIRGIASDLRSIGGGDISEYRLSNGKWRRVGLHRVLGEPTRAGSARTD